MRALSVLAGLGAGAPLTVDHPKEHFFVRITKLRLARG